MALKNILEKFNSVGEILKSGKEGFPNKVAVIFDEKRLDFLQLEFFSNKVASFLKKKNLGKGKKVCLYCTNIPEFIILYFGVVKTGSTVVPINIFLSPEEIKYIVENSECSAFIYFEGYEENVLKIRNSLPSLIISTGKRSKLNSVSLAEVFSLGEDEFEIPELNQKEDVCAILYTSGTTGKPKGAMLTHRNILFDIEAILKVVPVDEKDVFLTVLPLFHAFGATASMLTPLSIGATISLVLRFSPVEVAKRIKETKATVFMGVPSMYISFLNLLDNFIPYFSTLRFCISGGAPLPVEVKENFERKFRKIIYEGDGPTECSPVTAVNPIGGITKAGSIGKPLPGVEMKIVDEYGNELKDGEIGEIVVKG